MILPGATCQLVQGSLTLKRLMGPVLKTSATGALAWRRSKEESSERNREAAEPLCGDEVWTLSGSRRLEAVQFPCSNLLVNHNKSSIAIPIPCPMFTGESHPHLKSAPLCSHVPSAPQGASNSKRTAVQGQSASFSSQRPLERNRDRTVL